MGEPFGSPIFNFSARVYSLYPGGRIEKDSLHLRKRG